MAEEIKITEHVDKNVVYGELLPQLQALIDEKVDFIANMANVSAALKQAFGFFWVGFYLVKDGQLILGPFQGPVACTRIQKGKGVCGMAWANREIIIVDDVDEFPGHIACSSLSKSEIVVPIIRNGTVFGVLDVDSDKVNAFDETDAKYLLNVVDMLLFT